MFIIAPLMNIGAKLKAEDRHGHRQKPHRP